MDSPGSDVAHTDHEGTYAQRVRRILDSAWRGVLFGASPRTLTRRTQ